MYVATATKWQKPDIKYTRRTDSDEELTVLSLKYN